MTLSEDLINFDLIESHKENIQSLPSGRSARQLASILSPLPSGKTATLDETKTLNDAIRQEYEIELQTIADSDDPLDIYDRYVKWTLNAYPSAQSTPQSQLLPLLERATKAFITSGDYKNDPRYLKLWLHYIRLFSDAPRETFAFLARHGIAEHLALFYEEFASWLEGAGRWTQADEVYRLGVEREARPTERLMRKYNQFQQRYEAEPKNDNEPTSPALPRVRAALATKIDPFAPTAREDAQPTHQANPPATTATKPKKQKMAIFSDADNVAPPPATSASNGWDSVGSMRDRRKENTIEARPWAGETLKAGKRVGSASKMEVFKDPNEAKKSSNSSAAIVNPRTGRAEAVFVDMTAVYSENGNEFSFEELRALKRGWINQDWRTKVMSPVQPNSNNRKTSHRSHKSKEPVDIENLTETFNSRLQVDEETSPSVEDMVESKPSKVKKTKIREVKQEPQTVKTRLESPTGRKMKRKGSAEPTMTFHSKAAHSDIYDMFNHARKADDKDDTQSGDETDFGDDTNYIVVSDSFDTGRISTTASDYGDETSTSVRSFGAGDETDISIWSDFTTSKHVPKVNKNKKQPRHRHNDSEDFTEAVDSSQGFTQNGFDTVAIAALADQDFSELDTIAIAKLAGDEVKDTNEDQDSESNHHEVEDLQTPTEVESYVNVSLPDKPRYVPLPPEDYEPTPMRPYRDPEMMAQNKLPFMTPIVERTESSLASTIYHDKIYNPSKTPSRSAPIPESEFESPSKLNVNALLLGSPELEYGKRKSDVESHEESQGSPQKKLAAVSSIASDQKIAFPIPKSGMTGTSSKEPDRDADVFKVSSLPTKPVVSKARPVHKGPIIQDLQCNPCDPSIRDQILHGVFPPVTAYDGYVDHALERCNQLDSIRAFAKKVAKEKAAVRTSPKKTQLSLPILKLNHSSRVYAIRRQLGEGAFAPVYLVDSLVEDANEIANDKTRGQLEAVKAECPPQTLTWEYHILHLVRSRLGFASRTMQSIITARECHLFADECYLVLDYYSQGTLLDLINQVRSESVSAGKPAEGLEEPVAMWFSVELLRCVEELHKVGILHGDLKADNCLVRFSPEVEITAPYNRYGDNGWSGKGLMLIDLGRGIDVKAFKPEAKFVADWDASETDCAEIREARPWKWEIDLFGAAGIIHSLLFGKYIETIAVGGGGLGQKKEWKLKENFKRYWEKDLWTEVFSLLLNGGGLPADDLRRQLSKIRGLMESWLEQEGEKNGRDLRGGLRRCERLVGAGFGISNVGGKGKR